MSTRLTNILNAFQRVNAFVHVAASGAGTLIQHELWRTPGSSAWLSGASFPYDLEETNKFLGFTSEGVNRNTAIQLACKAYMKAYRFERSFPIGLGMTSSVASTVLHRGDHRIHGCIISPTKCLTLDVILEKNVGETARMNDNVVCNDVAFKLFESVLDIDPACGVEVSNDELLHHILSRPVFHANGARNNTLPRHHALMPGAYNPPHVGHYGIADLVNEKHMLNVVHHVTIDQPHKGKLLPQHVLERAKLLEGHDAIFTQGDSLYLDKVRKFPNTPFVIGTDALDRMFDPKWGVQLNDLLSELTLLGAKFYVNARLIDGQVETCNTVLHKHGLQHFNHVFVSLGDKHWNVSSTEIRNAALHRG